jgi:hypothetical protein
VIGGQDAFLVVARDLESFSEVIRRKLVREVAAARRRTTELAVLRTDCTGKTHWRGALVLRRRRAGARGGGNGG